MTHSPRPYSSLVRRALATQRALPDLFTPKGFPKSPRYIGGADAAFSPGPNGQRAGAVGSLGLAVAVIWDLQTRSLIEARFAATPVTFPYVPGLLSFREHPLLIAAIHRLRHPVDVWFFDAHGQAHPRRAGLATHMGIALNAPTIGAAKSLLIGHLALPRESTEECAMLYGAGVPVKHVRATSHPFTEGRTPSRKLPPPAPNVPAAPILYQFPTQSHPQQIARALWLAGPRKPPIYISQGQHCTLTQAIALTLQCRIEGKPLPAPTYHADRLSHRAKKLTPQAARQLIESLPASPARSLHPPSL